jgi:hypothetical protein
MEELIRYRQLEKNRSLEENPSYVLYKFFNEDYSLLKYGENIWI